MSFSSILPLVLTLGGGYMLIKLRFFHVLHPIRTFKELRHTLSDGECRKSLCLALAGTLGVGNIVGVAVGILVGGAGSVIWLLISSLFASILKYSESLLAADSSHQGIGMMAAISYSFKRCGRMLSYIYAVLCILLSLFMGAALQTSSVAISAACTVDFPPTLISVVFSLVVCLTLVFFSSAVKRLTSFVIPVTTITYICFSVASVCVNIARVPHVISEICSSAFSAQGIIGGGAGFLFSRAVSEGFSRGLLSNEAGAGTSALANSECGGTPSGAGLLGVCEVLFDTVILCTLTAFVILCAVPDVTLYDSGAELVVAAFGQSLGEYSVYVTTACIAFFALSTVICWYYYGVKCVRYVFQGGRGLFSVIFVGFVALGGFIAEGALILVCDIVLLGLSALSVLTVIKSSDRIKYLSELSGLLSAPDSKRRLF